MEEDVLLDAWTVLTPVGTDKCALVQTGVAGDQVAIRFCHRILRPTQNVPVVFMAASQGQEAKAGRPSVESPARAAEELLGEIERVVPGVGCVVIHLQSILKMLWHRRVPGMGAVLSHLIQLAACAPFGLRKAAEARGWVIAGVYRQYPGLAAPRYVVPWESPAIPAVDRLRLWCSVIALARRGGLCQRLHRMISVAVGLRFVQVLAPASVMVVTRVPGGRNMIEEACLQTFGEVRPWPVMMVRPMGLCLVPLYDRRRRAFDYLRIALDRRAANRMKRHARMCLEVRRLGLPFGVPHQVNSGQLTGTYFQIESQVDGVDGRRAPHRTLRMCSEAMQALVGMFKATSRPFDERVIRRWGRRMNLVQRLCITGTRPSTGFFEEAIVSVAHAMRFACLSQNDYHLGNLLFGRAGRLTGIIDWDLADWGGIPGADLCHLLVDLQMTVRGRDFRTAIEAFLAGRLKPGEDLVAAYCKDVGLSVDRRHLVLGYLIADAWRKAYFLHTERPHMDSAQYEALASQVNLSSLLMQEVLSGDRVA